MKPLLLILSLMLGGCVSIRAHRDAVEVAELRGRLMGQDQVLPHYRDCVDGLRAATQPPGFGGMDELADEVARKTDEAVGPPREPAFDIQGFIQDLEETLKRGREKFFHFKSSGTVNLR